MRFAAARLEYSEASCRWSATCLMVVLLFAGGASAMTIEEVEKAITQAQSKVQSYSAQTETRQDLDLGEGNRTKVESKGPMEWLQRDGKVLYRLVLKGMTVTTVAGTESKMKSEALMVCDGDFMYILNDIDGQKSAMKAKVDPTQVGDAKGMFAAWRKDWEVVVLPDEKHDGQDCYVVQLAPRKLAAQPADWSGMRNYTVYQTRRDDVDIDIPCRFTGAVRLQKRLRVPYHYPNESNARARYCNDLNLMRQAGLPDYRPFNGPIHFPYTDQDGTYFTLLTARLGVPTVNIAAEEVGSSWTFPTFAATYRIYPGGPEYTMQTAPSSLDSLSLAPDPATNPLGIYYRSGNIVLNGNASVQGSLACTGEVTLAGSSVSLDAVSLPPLAGTTTPIRLAALCAQNVTVQSSGGQINGLAVVFDKFQVSSGSENNAFTMAGKLVARKLELQERMVTLVMCVLDLQRHEVTMVSAGHMPPIVRSPNGEVRDVGDEAVGLPLGVVEGMDYDQHQFTLEPGEIVTLYTDGINEAMNVDDDEYSIPRLKVMIARPAPSIEAMGEAVLADVRRHIGARPQYDDMCLVAFGRL